MFTAESAQLPRLAVPLSENQTVPRHSLTVRVTHWINTVSFFGLLVSGFAILLAHPRFYWGETGALGTPSILDLPLPFMKGGPSGWGRNLHFLSAWLSVLNGSVYVLSGILTQHFRRNLVPAKSQLAGSPVNRVSSGYSVLQRLTYLAVVFGALPLMIWTGLAMSPAIVSVLPAIVTILGGHESARTIHFFAAGFLVLFLLVHIAMVCLAGFRSHVGAMIAGQTAGGEKYP